MKRWDGYGRWSKLTEPPRKAQDAGEAELDELQERLEGTLAEFKVEGDVAGGRRARWSPSTAFDSGPGSR